MTTNQRSDNQPENACQNNKTQHDEFVYRITNLVRTPVLASQRILDLLLSGAFGQLTVKQKEIIELVRRNESDLDHLLVSMTELHKYQNNTKQLVKEKLTIAEIIAKAETRFEKTVRGQHIAVKNSLPSAKTQVVGDKDELERLFFELLKNAAGQAKSWISLLLEANDGKVTVYAQSDGHGASEKDFGALSFALCQKIAEAHQGSLEIVKDQLGQNDLVVATLPAAKTYPLDPSLG